jgi:glycerol-3-phosphate dehydrogenase
MARTVDDVLSRRTRSLVLDARAAIEAAPTVTELMASELGRGSDWVEEQVDSFRSLAAGYILE